MRRFVKNLGTRRGFNTFQHLPPLPAFARKEAAEAKRVCGQAAGHQRRQKRRRPRNRHHWDMVSDRQGDQAEARVGDPRHAGVGHQGHARPALEIEHQLGGAGQFIVFVIADRARRDAVMVQQLLRLPGIFAGNLVGFLEHPHRPQRNVFQVADGRAHQVKSRRQRAFRIRGLYHVHEASLTSVTTRPACARSRAYARFIDEAAHKP